MLELVKLFEEKGIEIRFISDNFSTGMMECTNEGRKDAMERGVKFGRKTVIDGSKVVKLKEKGLNNSEIAKKLKISKATVIRRLKEAKGVSVEPKPLN